MSKKRSNRNRASIASVASTDKPAISVVAEEGAARKLSIQMRRRVTQEGEKRFWWPKFKKVEFKVASWSVATFTERHERYNAWPPRPWFTTQLEENNYYEKKIICGCLPMYRKKAHIPNPYETPSQP